MTLEVKTQNNECAYQWIHGYDSDYYKGNQQATTRDLCCDDPIGTYVVPVAVHVIKQGANIDYPTDGIVEAMISQANAILTPHFEFKLIKDPSNCSLVFRPSEVYSKITKANEIKIKNIGRVDPDLVLNIWMVNELDYFEDFEGQDGWAYSPIPNPTFPDELDPLRDGIVLAKNLGLSTLSETLVHEFGHYLSLHHVWGPIDEYLPGSPSVGNCDPSTCNQGDEVEDTESCKGSLPNTTFITIGSDCTYNQGHIDALASAGIPNPYCNSSGTYPCKNIMGYEDGRDELTDGQRCRMIDALQVYRPNLGAYVDGCAPDCTDPCDPCYVGTPYVDPNSITDPCDDCFAGPTSDPCIAWCTAEKEDVIINTSQVFTLDLVHGTLTINSGSTLTINSEVVFSPESRVVVKSGGRLIIESGGLLTNCPNGDLWQGVRIETTNLSPFGGGARGVEIRNGGVIEYAEIGIYKSLGQGASPSTVPSLKMTSGAIIRNCDTGIYFNNSGNSLGFLGEQENSIIDDSFFKENDTAIKLKFSNGLTLNRNTFEENYFGVEIINSKVDIYDNYFYSGDHIFIDAVYPSLVGINIERNVFSYGFAIRSQSTNNVDYLIVRKNTFIDSDIETHGLSRFVITENDIIDNSNKSIEHCATGDAIINQVHTNYFSNNHVGANIDGINNVEFLDNCFENTTRANIGLASNSKIRIEQGSEGRESGNNFDSGAKRFITSDMFIESEATPEPSSRYYKYQAGANPIWDQKEPNYEYAAYDYSIEEGAVSPIGICGTGSALYGGDFPIRHRDCSQFIEDNKNDIGELENLKSSLEDEIDRLWNLVLSGDLDNWIYQTLKNKYQECIDNANTNIVKTILSDPTGGPTRDPRDEAITFLKANKDFRFNIMAYSLMMNANEHVRASQYLSSLTLEREDQSDFIDVQNIYLSYLSDRNGFTLSENDRSTIYTAGMKRLPLAGFSRSIYYELTGERIFLDVPMYDNSTTIGKSRSNKDELSINVFPNPSQLSELININIEDELVNDVNYSVSVYNTHGTVIAEKIVKRGNHKITLPELSGILFISVSRNGMIVYTDRILRI